jgi:hypothetical protein
METKTPANDAADNPSSMAASTSGRIKRCIRIFQTFLRETLGEARDFSISAAVERKPNPDPLVAFTKVVPVIVVSEKRNCLWAESLRQSLGKV